MEYKILKLEFTTAVHFGKGGLEKSNNVLGSDTIFSALFIEALKYNLGKNLIEAFQNRKLKISSSFPYIGREYYIQKPVIRMESDNTGDSIVKKAIKKLKYIPISRLENFLNGSLDIKKEEEMFSGSFGKFVLVEKVSMQTEKDDFDDLYAVEVFNYNKNSGLYFFVAYEEEREFDMLKNLMSSISYTGIGGKISSGYGKFKLSEDTVPKELIKRFEDLENYKECMSLSICLPREEEIESSLEGASYIITKRSGFIASDRYADSFRKKKDLYMLEAGSVYSNIFEGNIYNVSIDGEGTHPVYRYGIPFFMGVI